MQTFTLKSAKAVIFDMDGTMIDNMMMHHRIWQKKLESMGLKLSLDEVKEKIHGINKEILKRLFGNKYTDEEIAFHAQDKEAMYRKEFKNSLKLVAGLDELLATLYKRKCPLAIGSAAPKANIDFSLDTLKIRHFFQVVKCSEDVKKGKPNPEIYLSIMDELKVNPQDVVIFEDSPTGAEAACESGAKTVVLTTTHKVEDFKHLPKIAAFIPDFSAVEWGE